MQGPLSPVLQLVRVMEKGDLSPTTARQKWRWDNCLKLTSSGLVHSHLYKRSALLCCPGKIQGLLSSVLQLVGSRGSSRTLMTSGPTLPPLETLMRGGFLLPTMPPYGRWGCGKVTHVHILRLTHLCLHPQGHLYCASQTGCRACFP